MSKVKVDSILDLNSDNEVSVERVKEITSKSDYADWYIKGDVVSTTKNLDNQDFLEINNNIVIDQFLHSDLYNTYSSKNKKLTKQNTFIPVDYKTDEQDSILYIQIDDLIFFEFFGNTSDAYEVQIDGSGKITRRTLRSITPNIDPTTITGKINWDTNFIAEENKVVLYLKLGADLYFYFYDYGTGTEYIEYITGFFQVADSTVKITEKYAYELTADTLYRYDLQKTNATPDSTVTTVFTKVDLDATYTNTFSGSANSDFYGFGEDIDIVFFKDQTQDDRVVFSDKESFHFEYYISPITDTFTTTDIINNAVLISNNTLTTESGTSLEIHSELYEGIILENPRAFIFQNSDELTIGSLGQIPPYDIGDQLKSEDSKNVYNFGTLQIIDLNTNSFIAHEIIPESLTIPKTLGYCFDIISSNKKSLTLLSYYKNPDDMAVTSGTITFSQQNKVYNVNFKTGTYNSSANTYESTNNHDTYKYDIVDQSNKILKIQRLSNDFSSATLDYFYQLRKSGAAIRGVNDKQYSTIVEGINNNLIVMLTQQGYFFQEVSKDKNINTYIKI